MTPATQTEFNFTKPIVGKSKRGNAWAIEFDWKLPGSKYNLVVYERDPETIEGWNVGDCPTVTIVQGALKEGKDGQYNTDYFYDLASIEEASDSPEDWGRAAGQTTPPLPDRQRTPPTAQGRIKPLHEDAPPLPQALGACQNHAMAFIQSGIIAVPPDRDPLNFLWELRDRIYRNVNQRPYQPEHWCYQHQCQNEQSKRSGLWGHVMPSGAPCIEPQDATTESAKVKVIEESRAL